MPIHLPTSVRPTQLLVEQIDNLAVNDGLGLLTQGPPYLLHVFVPDTMYRQTKPLNYQYLGHWLAEISPAI